MPPGLSAGSMTVVSCPSDSRRKTQTRLMPVRGGGTGRGVSVGAWFVRGRRDRGREGEGEDRGREPNERRTEGGGAVEEFTGGCEGGGGEQGGSEGPGLLLELQRPVRSHRVDHDGAGGDGEVVADDVHVLAVRGHGQGGGQDPGGGGVVDVDALEEAEAARVGFAVEDQEVVVPVVASGGHVDEAPVRRGRD